MGYDSVEVPLRGFLKNATRSRHDRLDATLSQESFAENTAYSAFLQVQLAARAPIEGWIASHCPADIAPPPTAHLLIADLAALGATQPLSTNPFSLPTDADPLGLSWAIAGSHLGNRMLLQRLRKTAPAAPCAFLADEAMLHFWQGLRERLDQPAGMARAQRCTMAANAVFDHFLLCARTAHCAVAA